MSNITAMDAEIELETRKPDFGSYIRRALPFSRKREAMATDGLRSPQERIHALLRIMLHLFALFGLFNLLKQAHTKFAEARHWSAGWREDGMDWIDHECFCGETYEEALAAGCQFDELASIWLRPQCIDVELSREFARSGPGPGGAWPYYVQANDTTPIYAAELSMLPDLFAPTWTVFEWHVQHCTFYWRKLFRQPITHVVMEPHFDIEHHVVHCGMGFLMRNNLSSITAGVAHVRPRGMIDIRGWTASDTFKTKYEQIDQ